MPIIKAYKGKFPQIAPDAFIAEDAVIIGDVVIESKASVWYGCVIRGDVNYIRIGEGSNIQDGTIVHVNRNNGPTLIGKGVTVGHQALLHACTLEDYCFIGMGAKVIDGAKVESNAMVAAGSMVAPNKIIKSDEIWAGVPAKFFRVMTEDEKNHIKISEQNYIELASQYLDCI